MANRILKPDSSNNLILQDGDSVSRVTLNAGGTSVLSDEGGTSALSIQADGDIDIAENIYLASGKGIYFDGGTTSANYLGGSDAYEEGTFTPVITNWTFTVNKAGYTKIGNVVTIQIYLVGTGGTAPSGYTAITGLPFTTGSSQATLAAFVVDKSNAYKRFPCAGYTPGTIASCSFDMTFLEHYESFVLANDDQLQIGGTYIT